VPRGVALGLLVGDHRAVRADPVRGAAQRPVRANVPLAALATFVTNPFTTPLIWVVRVLGRRLAAADRRGDRGGAGQRRDRADRSAAFLEWLTGATMVTAFGLVVIAVSRRRLSYLLSGHLAHGCRRGNGAAGARRRQRRLPPNDSTLSAPSGSRGLIDTWR
jgi:hypothetical protein